mmetsp:Transcript_30776/g.27999  ORF Transcript_30776/g.27999 Transcript_30776/m.27999 type:complete len:90 (+) Transcript_30776:18-287(+)
MPLKTLIVRYSLLNAEYEMTKKKAKYLNRIPEFLYSHKGIEEIKMHIYPTHPMIIEYPDIANVDLLCFLDGNQKLNQNSMFGFFQIDNS